MTAEAEEIRIPEVPRFRHDRRLSRFALRSLLAETVEFAVAYASEECVPFIRRESENGPFGFPAVTDPDLAAG